MTTPYFISALRNEYGQNSFYRYFANAADGEGATLSYSFLTSVPDGTPTTYGDPTKSFETYSDEQKILVRQALDAYQSVADIHFTETDGTADIRFGQFTMDGNVAGYADYPQYQFESGELSHGPSFGEVWLKPSSLGANNSFLVLHEIGHALGLEHPFEGDFQLPDTQDNTDNTVMSYTFGNNQPLAPQIFDVIALQSIYGPAQLRTGDDTYVFGADKLIWDGGGTDTITASDAADKVTMDINDGSWDYVGAKTDAFVGAGTEGQVYLGNFTMIENLIGSSFADHLTGNELANAISAGGGRDVVLGGGGRDRLTGGSGADTLWGGKGADRFIFSELSDSTTAAKGRDKISDFLDSQHDRFDVSAIDANARARNDQDFNFIGDARFSNHAGELRYVEKNGNAIVSGDVNGDGAADFSFLIIGHGDLMKADFLL